MARTKSGIMSDCDTTETKTAINEGKSSRGKGRGGETNLEKQWLMRRNVRQREKKKSIKKDKDSERKGEARHSLQMKHLTMKESSNKY